MQISNENSFREGFRRQGSQEGFPEGGLTVIKGFQRESFQRDVKSESFQSQQPSFWTPASESVCLSVASQSRAIQVAVHIFNRQCLGRVLRKSGRREGFQDRVYRGVVPRVGLQKGEKVWDCQIDVHASSECSLPLRTAVSVCSVISEPVCEIESSLKSKAVGPRFGAMYVTKPC